MSLKTILFTNARDEDNIIEWIAHHLIIGFDIIYIFDHKSIIPIKELTKIFKKGVIVERYNIDGPIKLQLMVKAAKIAQSAGADWMLYLDADEYLVLNKFSNVKQLLYQFHQADSIAINWLMFGTNHHKYIPKKGLLIENYTSSDLKLDKHVKSFVRPSQVIKAITPHYFVIKQPNKMTSLNGKQCTSFNEWNISFELSPAFIAHYVYQSEEMYMKRKILLPRDDNSQFRHIEHDIHQKHNECNNTLVKDKYAKYIQQLLDKLQKI
uniref:Glycosyltransferase 2-like domain-containing protein n=1 Tax=viral metagenome TaxID=1070528 RepID=A0A6C0AZL5_9ZZZZ